MQNIYGYKKEETQKFIEYVKQSKETNLSTLFKNYANLNGKAEGSIRNLYYAIAKRCNEDTEFCNTYFNGEKLKVNRPKEFTEEEKHYLIKTILLEKLKGKSTRSIVTKMANNNAKMALRYQNKYLNVKLNEPKYIEQVKKELGISTCSEPYATNYLKSIDIKRYNQLKLAVENLVEKIVEDANLQNKTLQTKLNAEIEENKRLKNILYKNTVNKR